MRQSRNSGSGLQQSANWLCASGIFVVVVSGLLSGVVYLERGTVAYSDSPVATALLVGAGLVALGFGLQAW